MHYCNNLPCVNVYQQHQKLLVHILRVLIFLIPLVFTSCAHSFLSVYSDYLTERSLASYHVDTPDPLKICPSIGQRLIVTWSLPKCYQKIPHLYLDVQIKFRNLTERREFVPITRLNDTYVYEILNEDYRDTQGFLTYLVILMQDQHVLQQWRHSMWTDLILLQAEKEENLFSEDNEDCNALDNEFEIPSPTRR